MLFGIDSGVVKAAGMIGAGGTGIGLVTLASVFIFHKRRVASRAARTKHDRKPKALASKAAKSGKAKGATRAVKSEPVAKPKKGGKAKYGRIAQDADDDEVLTRV